MKIVLAALAGIVLLATGTAVYWGVEGRTARRAADSLQAKIDGIRAKQGALEVQLAGAERQVRAVDDENARLLSKVPMSSAAGKMAAKGAVSGEAATPITREGVEARLKRARELVRDGDAAEALVELLWCYDEGAVRVAVLSALRHHAIPAELERLGQKYPPALTALRERRDRLEAEVLTDGANAMDGLHLSSLNQVLGDSARTLAIFDKLPETDRRRDGLAVSIYGELVSMRRYKDVARNRTYSAMLSQFEYSTTPSLSTDLPNAEGGAAAQRTATVAQAAQDIEVLIGVGDLESARDFARKVVAFDGTAQTRTLIDQHVARGGRPQPLFDEKSP